MKLEQLGLSSLDIRVYSALLKDNVQTVSELATSVSLSAVGLYRSLNRLKERGFIVETGSYPKRYQSRALDDALDHYLNYQESLTNKLRSKSKPASNSRMEVLTGQQEIFNTYINLAKDAEADLLTISIGEKVPEELYQTKAEVMKRGVKNYLLFQKHTKENDLWLKRWKSMGSKVRILPGEGYHLNIIDNRYAILSSSNPSNTTERTAVLIDSQNIILELRKYFFQQWQQARELSPLTLTTQ